MIDASVLNNKKKDKSCKMTLVFFLSVYEFVIIVR